MMPEWAGLQITEGETMCFTRQKKMCACTSIIQRLYIYAYTRTHTYISNMETLKCLHASLESVEAKELESLNVSNRNS